MPAVTSPGMRVSSEDPGLNPGNEPQDEIGAGAADAESERLPGCARQLVQTQNVRQCTSLQSR